MEKHQLIQRFSADQLQQRVRELADEIRTDYRNRQLVVIGILKGAFIFLADLIRHLNIPSEVDFIRLASYGSLTESSGSIRVTKDIELPIAGKHVLVVEDIVDSGITMAWLLDHLRGKNPESVKTCVCIDKCERREKSVAADYIGFRVTQGFLVGYGLDWSEQYRYLPDIYEVKFL